MKYRLATGMQPAIPQVCPSNHKFYREQGSESGCPFCLFAELKVAHDTIRTAQQSVATAAQALKCGRV